jgi:transposase
MMDRRDSGFTFTVVCLVPSPSLSIVPASLAISRVLPTTQDITIEAGLVRSAVGCPDCGLLSRRLHSHYPRVLRDLPWQGRPAKIRVTARRFRCLNSACARKTFAERLGSAADSDEAGQLFQVKSAMHSNLIAATLPN